MKVLQTQGPGDRYRARPGMERFAIAVKPVEKQRRKPQQHRNLLHWSFDLQLLAVEPELSGSGRAQPGCGAAAVNRSLSMKSK